MKTLLHFWRYLSKFLHLALHRLNIAPEFSIFRKPTYADITIPFHLCHPKEQILAAVSYLINRWNYYKINPDAKDQDFVFQNIQHYNSFPLQIIKKLQTVEREQFSTVDSNTKPHSEWVTSTFFGSETRRITKLLTYLLACCLWNKKQYSESFTAQQSWYT
jgi:hypothetical protein